MKRSYLQKISLQSQCIYLQMYTVLTPYGLNKDIKNWKQEQV